MNNPIIRFYSHTKGPYKFLSNFYPSVITDDKGRTYTTAEHFFQAWKHIDETGDLNQHGEKVRTSSTPAAAKKLARSVEIDMTSWDKRKLDIMRVALKLKFEDPSLRRMLQETAPGILIEASPTDYIWGEGKNKTGTNYLGVLLMELRD